MAKSSSAFRTISEVAEELDLPQHVLRFWESKFSVIKPMKRGGGRRYYRPQDIEILRRIRGLLYDDGYTIKGAQKLFREGGKPSLNEDKPKSSEDTSGKVSKVQKELKSVLGELEDIRVLLGA
ncbi:MAG: MerR family transcriptional regulator [Rhodospirillaceae bacterium]|nr:MerR family transcriptional regulator [Rhodospirillaceae bacterium]MBL6941427.1 MerR family transcriptional regulator [Rhodospirillales bacterium]